MQRFIVKKSLSIFLALVMAISLTSGLSLTAFAYEEESPEEYLVETEIELTSELALEPETELTLEAELEPAQEPALEPAQEAESELVSLDETSVTIARSVENQAEEITVTSAGYTITQDGVYQIADGSTGMITIAAGVTNVWVIGGGAEFDSDGTMITTPFTSLRIDCSAAPGITLTLEDIYINNVASSNLINFSGTGNHLNFEGASVIDHQLGGGGSYALIHVGIGTELTIGGAGTLYLYKQGAGAGFGGNSGEYNGTIVFEMTGYGFMKGTNQGALIGAGSAASANAALRGSITFNSGTYNMENNGRGASIGGSAGSNGATAGTEVYFNGGSININVDYSGSAVGGGGYDGGNDSAGGNAYFSGGSLRTYVDKNAAGNTTWGYASEGINDLVVTAKKQDINGNAVYKCVFDTNLLSAKADYIIVYVDDAPFFNGGLHEYRFIQEALDKGEQYSISSTPSNWVPGDDENLYLYLTGEDHVITVNGEEFEVIFDESIVDTSDVHTIGPFTIAAGEASEPEPAQATAPAIISQPVGASYTVGNTAAALTVAASVSDGGTLSYQWYSDTVSSTSGATAIAGAVSDLYTPGTSAAGMTYYFCVVTNTLDATTATATSAIAAVTVEAAINDASRTVDFSWYNTTDTTFTITTPEQWDALAWLVGGQIAQLSSYAETYNLGLIGEVPSATDTFDGKTVLLGADLNMGGIYDAQSDTWSGRLFMSVGGRYYYDDNKSNVRFGLTAGSQTFNGSFNGQGHKIYNINADYGNGGDILGLFGQVTGVNSVIENVWVGEGYFNVAVSGAFAGGVVGRMNGINAVVQNCVNEASVNTTGSNGKGCGGIVGALWAGQGVFNCVNFGSLITNDYAVAGVVGQIQAGVVENCYNEAAVTRTSKGTWAAIATLTSTVTLTRISNCYYYADEAFNTYGVTLSNSNDATTSFTDAGLLFVIEPSWGGEYLAARLGGTNSGAWAVSSDGVVLPSVFVNGQPATYAVTVDNLTNSTASVSLVSGSYAGEQTFTVSSSVACVVAYSTDGGATYTRLTAAATASADVYSFTVDVESDMIIAVVVKGDVNGDGVVNAFDQMQVTAAAKGLLSLTPLQTLAADVNVDGVVNAFDQMQVTAVAKGQLTLNW